MGGEGAAKRNRDKDGEREATMRDPSKTVRCLFCFMFIAELGASLNCTTSCGNRGVDIRFPFWIKDRQPDQCGYPGFALSCNERGDIVLEPTDPQGCLLRQDSSYSSSVFHIEKIDYRNQVILASDPQGFLLRQDSSYSSSVFHLQFKMSKVNFTIFNCSSNNARSQHKIACLSTPLYDVLAVDSELSIDDDESLLSCTKMYDLPVPHDIRLSWSSPNCGSCEATGQQCVLRKNNITEHETECYGLHKEFESCIACGFEQISSTCCEVPDKWVTCAFSVIISKNSE
ncbi:hypothetical protein DKX38_011816 [Salix brachista]|uniref:RING-type E3 ubiquitin transferase n=1 Tax=Salix brachista TaxID=2182728 RepID=A0A5N5M012_9ROSI|nr:hypothetical protein DKX38_011816 [Salix brachista]